MRNLIVDDDEPICKRSLRYLGLRDAGIEADYVLDGNGAMSYLEACVPDLIVLDVQLPDGTGFRLCEKIKEKFNMPIISYPIMARRRTASADFSPAGMILW